MPRPATHTRKCPQCGGPKPNLYALQCRECWQRQKNPPDTFCVDCGKKFSTGERYTRCRECYNAFRIANRPVSICTVEGCEQPFYARGMCRSHYQVGRRTAFWGNTVVDRAAHTLVGQQPCAACGYSRMKSEVHRPQAKGPYVVGNMVPLCSRCHDEVERGLTPCPPPWQPT